MSGRRATGPWRIRVNGVFLRVVHGEHNTTVADGIVTHSYANLIAAAPELLEALECALETLENEGVCGPECLSCASARAAIAKARGAS
jgi:hypothetical protein